LHGALHALSRERGASKPGLCIHNIFDLASHPRTSRCTAFSALASSLAIARRALDGIAARGSKNFFGSRQKCR
jgi:hypothetical protein